MKIEAAEYSSPTATPELIKELFADDKKRGEFMILAKGEYDFIQVAGDAAADGFTLEYREGGREGKLYHCPRTVTREEAEAAFLDYLDGIESWKSRFAWEDITPKVSDGKRERIIVAIAIAGIIVYAIYRIMAS